MPYPVTYFRKIDTFFVDVLFVSYEHIVHLLDQEGTFVSKLWKVLDDRFCQVETVDLVLNSHVEWSCDRTLFLISKYMKITVCSIVCQLMNQSWISVECEDDWFIFCEDSIIFCICQSVRMFGIGFQLHKVNYVYETDLEVRNVVTKDCNSSQSIVSSVGVSPQHASTTSGSSP